MLDLGISHISVNEYPSPEGAESVIGVEMRGVAEYAADVARLVPAIIRPCSDRTGGRADGPKSPSFLVTVMLPSEAGVLLLKDIWAPAVFSSADGSSIVRADVDTGPPGEVDC